MFPGMKCLPRTAVSSDSIEVNDSSLSPSMPPRAPCGGAAEPDHRCFTYFDATTIIAKGN